MENNFIKKIPIYYTLLLILLSLIPVPDLGFPSFKLFEMDKLIHFIMYSIFIIVWGLKIGFNKIKMFSLIIYSILLGLFLEILQHLLPFGRYFDLGDYIIVRPRKWFNDGDSWTVDLGLIGGKENLTDKMLDDVIVVPNPYVVSSLYNEEVYGNRLIFDNLPRECTITIYTATGELVEFFLF